MIRFLISVTTLLLGSIFNVNGQNSDRAFFYSATYISDSTERESKGEDLMVLWTGKDYSVFESYYRYQLDSFKTAASNQSSNPADLNMQAVLQQAISMRKPSFNFIVHKSLNDKEITVYNNLFFDNFRYEQPLVFSGWKIGNQKEQILGFSCQKATIAYAGREFIAWFSEEIPISDGPYVFNGLPGLILKIEDVKGDYRFELIGIQNKQVDMERRILSKSIDLSKEQFFRTKSAMYKDVRKALLGKPTSAVSDDTILDVQQRYDKMNNPLELVYFK